MGILSTFLRVRDGQIESDHQARIPDAGSLEGLYHRHDPESAVYVVLHLHSFSPRAFGRAGQIPDLGARSKRRRPAFRGPETGARAHKAGPAAIRAVARGYRFARGTRSAPSGPFQTRRR